MSRVIATDACAASAQQVEPVAVRILLAEDNRADAILVRHALTTHRVTGELHIVIDGEEAFRTIDRIDHGLLDLPDIVLLDLNLPRREGTEVLGYLRRSQRCSQLPVVIVTSSDAPRDRELTAALGISAYFRKPSDYDEFMELGGLVRRLVVS